MNEGVNGWDGLGHRELLLLFSYQVMSNSLQLHETAARQASLSFTVCWNLLRLRSVESVIPSNHLIPCHPFSSCPQSFPASGSFPLSQLFTWDGQSAGASASASVFPKSSQSWFPLGPTGWSSCCRRGLSTVAGCRGPPGTPSSARESLPQAPFRSSCLQYKGFPLAFLIAWVCWQGILMDVTCQRMSLFLLIFKNTSLLDTEF